jgi:large subunit ribosomal protein L24
VKNRFKPKFNIRKDDSVVVIAGDDKDRTTPKRVMAVMPMEGRILVEGVNIVTKHLKPNAANPQGAIVKEEAPIHISNVMLWDPKAKAPAKISRERIGTGSGFKRISKISGEEIK